MCRHKMLVELSSGIRSDSHIFSEKQELAARTQSIKGIAFRYKREENQTISIAFSECDVFFPDTGPHPFTAFRQG